MKQQKQLNIHALDKLFEERTIFVGQGEGSTLRISPTLVRFLDLKAFEKVYIIPETRRGFKCLTIHKKPLDNYTPQEIEKMKKRLLKTSRTIKDMDELQIFKRQETEEVEEEEEAYEDTEQEIMDD